MDTYLLDVRDGYIKLPDELVKRFGLRDLDLIFLKVNNNDINLITRKKLEENDIQKAFQEMIDKAPIANEEEIDILVHEIKNEIGWLKQ